jgi:hypothetical protein
MEAPIEKIVATYIKMRDTKDALYKEYTAKASEIEEQMLVLKHKLIEISKETGVTSFSTPYGVAYRTVKNRYWTNDWGVFTASCVSTVRWNYLRRGFIRQT